MLAFVLRRVLQSLLVILVVALVAFGLFRYVGDPSTTWSARTPATSIAPRCASASASTIPCWCSSPASPGKRGARRVRPLLPPGAQGLDPDRRAAAGDARAELRRRAAGARRRRADGRLYRAQPRPAVEQSCSWRCRWSAYRLPTFLIGILLILVFSVLLGWLPAYGRRRGRPPRLVDDRAC